MKEAWLSSLRMRLWHSLPLLRYQSKSRVSSWFFLWAKYLGHRSVEPRMQKCQRRCGARPALGKWLSWHREIQPCCVCWAVRRHSGQPAPALPHSTRISLAFEGNFSRSTSEATAAASRPFTRTRHGCRLSAVSAPRLTQDSLFPQRTTPAARRTGGRRTGGGWRGSPSTASSSRTWGGRCRASTRSPSTDRSALTSSCRPSCPWKTPAPALSSSDCFGFFPGIDFINSRSGAVGHRDNRYAYGTAKLKPENKTFSPPSEPL